MQLTFRDTASLLRANGYACAPLADNGAPVGPWAVLQIDWSRYTQHADDPVAVLTSVPVARNPEAPVQNARDTWLVAVTIKVRDELVKEADAIVAKYIGGAKCPARVADDGSTLRVFRLAGGAQFSTIVTDSARIESAAAFVPVNGEWRGGISVLDVFRHELPELDHDRAQQLVGELNALLAAHTPRSESVLPPPVPRPLLEPGQRLLFGNVRAMDTLRQNGFRPLPVRWGQDDVERNGYSDFMGNWHYNVDLSDHSIGLNLSGFAMLEFVTRFRADVDEAIRAMGPCLVRTAAGDDRPVYLFRCVQGGKDETVYSPDAHVKVRRCGLLVLSGADMYGRQYQWSQDLLTTKAGELATFELHDAQRLARALESLPTTDYSKAAAPKRRKSA